MDDNGCAGIFYPTVEELIEVHDEIIDDDPNAEPGIRNRGQLDYAIDHIRYGTHGEVPETLHGKAFQLMRLIAANHPFVDGNKRTALASTIISYFWNGHALKYQEELESMLILLAIREDFIDANAAVEYLQTITEKLGYGVFGVSEGITEVDLEIAFEQLDEGADDEP